MPDGTLVATATGCLVALVSALAVVSARKPIYSAVALLAHSLSLAALFAILGAGLVAVGQVIIYAGAIVVLFLFVVTLLPSGGRELPLGAGRVVAGLIAGGALLVALATAISGSSLLTSRPAAAAVDVASIGRALFGPLLVAFELTAPLLLVAIVGAVAIWRRHEPGRPPVERIRSKGPRTLEIHR